MPIDVAIEAGIATVTVNRPDAMNAIDLEHATLLRDALEELGSDETARVVVLTGAGEKAFIAGADIKYMRDLDVTGAKAWGDLGQRCGVLLETMPKPTIAAVNGFALGGGCELALCADFRVAGEGAKLGQPEILLGVIPGAGGTQRLARLIGASRAKDLIFTGRMVKADEAQRIGLVDQVVPDDQVYAAAHALAARFVGGPAYALRAAKEAIDRGLETDIDSGLEIERLQFTGLFATKDRTTGMTSFVEQGPGKAAFEGR